MHGSLYSRPMSSTTTTPAGVLHTADRTIYEVNVRQYTPEGTFDAFRAHLPRLEQLGVGILWLMPIHPIGRVGRKGSLGSYYAASDYDAINPEFGDEDSFRALVDDAHARGMHVILDWVANHTSHDHVWIDAHPHRYHRDDDGNFTLPVPDWTDTYGLNYADPTTRAGMRDAMARWIREFGIDGYRCDVAAMVPRDFWEEVIPQLRAIKPIFMLAEAEESWLHEAGFDATYAWPLGNALIDMVAGKKSAGDVRAIVHEDAGIVGSDGLRMHFTTNHDWNSWEGVASDRFGPALDAATVLTFTLPGMPLIYSGQEAGLDKAIEFFDKDEIAWRDHHHAELFRQLIALKRTEPALRHGPGAGAIEFLDTGDTPGLIAFRRTLGESEITVFANLSGERAAIPGGAIPGGEGLIDHAGAPASAPASLDAWGWTVLRRAR
ncbi:MAG: hypothetical protein DHS20C14_17430 [Phycisphaeraceae bacterium]|nr:MAG: hypothetical protein DHS20C14_17430 [Phycisphaeraceae bacterium]